MQATIGGRRECYDIPAPRSSPAVGTPIENVEMRVVDPDDREVPQGELGEIVIRGPNVMQGYFGKPEETARALRGGFLHTGDLGRLADGFLYVTGRKKDVINVGGLKVWPAEVEAPRPEDSPAPTCREPEATCASDKTIP